MEIGYISNTFTKDASEDDNYIKISGWASTNTLDRHGDIINPKAWKGGTKGFDASPVLLYSHDHKDVIGKVTSYNVDEEKGLFIEAEISKRWERSYMVTDGLLKTFSVGFRPRGKNWYKYHEDKDVFEILKAELLEVSVVSVPANPTATFSVKSFFDINNKDNMKFFEQVKSFVVGLGLASDDATEADVLNALKAFDSAKMEKSIQDIEEGLNATKEKGEVFEKTISDALERVDVLEVELSEKSDELNQVIETMNGQLEKAIADVKELSDKYVAIKSKKKTGEPNENDSPSVKRFKQQLGTFKVNAKIN